jgi:diguanylate cyclase (GGDEF)-like protein
LSLFDRALRIAPAEVDRQDTYATMAVTAVVAAASSVDETTRSRLVRDGTSVAAAALDPEAGNLEALSRCRALAARGVLAAMAGFDRDALRDAAAATQAATEHGFREGLVLAAFAEALALMSTVDDVSVAESRRSAAAERVVAACRQARVAGAEGRWTHLDDDIDDLEARALWSLGRTSDAAARMRDTIRRHRLREHTARRDKWSGVRMVIGQLQRSSVRDHDSDRLTGLQSRRALDRGLTEIVHQGEPVCVAVIDLDHFADVNKRHGYVAGDRVLQELSEMLERACRRGDMVGRLHKDRFAMVLRGVSLGDARRVFDRIRSTIATRPWSGLPEGATVSASIGVTIASSGRSAQDVMDAAERAVRESKAAGGNRLTVD